jgi:hypothetical protein
MRIRKITMLTTAAMVGLGVGMAPAAKAAFIATIEQVGGDVVVTGSGSLNLSDLTFIEDAGTISGMYPDAGRLSIGPSASVSTSIYYVNSSGPSNFGSGGITSPSSGGSGDRVSLEDGYVYVPSGYVSGAPLSDTSTYADQTLSSLGLTLGTYVTTWGNGGAADSFTIQIISSIPEPASLVFLATGLAALEVNRRRGRKVA